MDSAIKLHVAGKNILAPGSSFGKKKIRIGMDIHRARNIVRHTLDGGQLGRSSGALPIRDVKIENAYYASLINTFRTQIKQHKNRFTNQRSHIWSK